MAIISFTKEQIYGHLNAERYELLLFRGELLAEGLTETGRGRSIEFVLPLIDRRLQEIEEDRNRLGLPPSDTAEYADRVRDGEEEIAEVAAQYKRDQADRI